MPKEKKDEIKLPSLGDIFSSQEERDDANLKRIYEIPLDKIDSFPNHPYKVRDDEDMAVLVESIRTKGIITPCMVRKKGDDRFELISGHRRKRACEALGMSKLRCEVVDLNREESIIMMVESNFQRSKVLPSEKAFAYKMRLEALNRQGYRSDLTLSPMGTKLGRSSEDITNDTGDSRNQIYRFIRLTELTSELLELVDNGEIALRPAVEISYLTKESQNELYEIVRMEQCTPTHAQAIRMRRMAESNKLTTEVIEAIMQEEKPNQRDRIVLRGDRFASLFPRGLPVSKREDYVAAAMEHYRRFLTKKEKEQER